MHIEDRRVCQDQKYAHHKKIILKLTCPMHVAIKKLWPCGHFLDYLCTQ